MPNLPQFGMTLIPGLTEAPLTSLSSTDAVAQEFDIDAGLPVVGRKYIQPFPEIVIPKFRFVGVKKTSSSTTGKPVLTLATSGTSSYVSPIGIAADDIWRISALASSRHFQPTVLRNCYVQYPYVSSINNANGTLYRGDYIVPDGYGRPVKFIRKGNYLEYDVAATNTTVGSELLSSIFLNSATLAGVTPENVSVWNHTDLTTETIATSAWQASAGMWRLDFLRSGVTPTTSILLAHYDYGHEPADIGGQLVQLDVDFPTSNWIKWVSFNFGNFPVTPLGGAPAPVTAVTAGASTANADYTVYTVANTPISPIHSVIVYVNGTAETKSSITGLYNGDLQGTNYVVDPLAGTVTFPTGYCTVASTVTVTYSYLTNYDIGSQAWATGLHGLTDTTVAPVSLQPGFPPEYTNAIDGGSSATGGMFIEIL